MNRNLFWSSFGNALEWFSYALYGGFSINISHHFFGNADSHINTLLTYGIFSIGFLSRPIGGCIFGIISDKVGRANSLFLSIALMAFPTCLIGMIPSFNSIGIYAPVLLIIIRALQGLAIGGEYTGAMVYLVEQAKPSKRGFLGSFADFGCLVGTLLGGSFITFVLSNSMTKNDFNSFGWKIPFILSVLIFFVGYYINKLERQNTEQKSDNSDNISIKELLKKHRKTCIYVAASSAFSGVNFYTLLVFIPNYIAIHKIDMGIDPFLITSTVNLIMVPAVLIFGVLSDKFKRKPLIMIGISGVIFLSYPVLTTFNRPFLNICIQILYGIFLAAYFGGRSAFFSEAFPKTIRCTAVSISLSISHAVFAGSTPLLATFLDKFCGIEYFVLHIIFVSLFALYGFYHIKDRTGEPLQ